MVSVALVVWSVDSTRWPVSPADRAAWMVSGSRISPIRMTSGSWRRTRRMAWDQSLVSVPISRWLMIDILSRWSTSMGSSMVMMLAERLLLMWSIMAARVVVLPDPSAR